MMRSGRAYQRRLWAPVTSETGGGALPTPRVQEPGRTNHGYGDSVTERICLEMGIPTQKYPSSQQDLSNTENWLPTPQARDHKTASKPGSARMQRKMEQGWSPSLEEALLMLPTPSACVANDGERPETWLARRERVKLTAKNGNGMGMPLTIAAQLLTPCASDWKGRTNWVAAEHHGPQRLPDCLPTGAATYLNPSFVEEMMGYPIGHTA